MTERERALHFLERARARVEGTEPEPGPEQDSVRYARDRLEDALPHVHGGTELPEDARLRPVKAAVLTALRPITSNQEPFNVAVLAALDGLTDAVERLSHRVERADAHVTRTQTTVATNDLTLDGVVADLRDLSVAVDEAVAASERLEDTLASDVAALRSELGALRAQVAEVARVRPAGA